MSAVPALSLSREERRGYTVLAEHATGATFIAADTLSVLLAFAVTIVLRGTLGGGSLWPQYFRLTPCLVVIPLLICLLGLYPGVLLNPVEEFRRLTIAIALGMSLMVVVTFLFGESAVYSRIIFLAAIPLGVGMALTGRWIVRKVYPAAAWWGIPTVLVGPRADVENIRRRMEAHPSIGIRPVAALEVEADNPREYGELPIGRGAAPYALVVLPFSADRRWICKVERIVWGCKKIIVVPQSMGLLWSWMRIRDCCGEVGLEVHRELLRRRSRIVKQAMDSTLAVMGGILIAPVVVAIALSIRLTSRGPVFYGHKRIGEGGASFSAWKFRTMVTNADEQLELYLQQNPDLRKEWEADHKLRKDPRVTRIGHFLRETSLDELPQLWNVIRGEMSLVGPRPIVRAESEKYGEEFDLYQKVRPGITGLWQVSGRNNTTYRERVAMDVQYVRNWSVWLDFYVLAKTVGVVLRKQGAY